MLHKLHPLMGEPWLVWNINLTSSLYSLRQSLLVSNCACRIKVACKSTWMPGKHACVWCIMLRLQLSTYINLLTRTVMTVHGANSYTATYGQSKTVAFVLSLVILSISRVRHKCLCRILNQTKPNQSNKPCKVCARWRPSCLKHCTITVSCYVKCLV